MGPVLVVVGVVAIVAGSILTRASARRAWGDDADNAYRALGKSSRTAPAVGVPAWVSFIVLLGWVLVVVGGIVWVVF